jgi:aminoglycoside 2'-N-acetyltransferase I
MLTLSMACYRQLMMSGHPVGEALCRSVSVQLAHTCDLDRKTLDRARDLLDVVFAGDLRYEDWEHCLGGLHALAWLGDRLVGHASVIQRRLLLAGRALRAGYVEGVGVHPGWQGQGIGGQLMAPLEAVIARAYELGALGATDRAAAFYARRGWIRWRGPTSALTPAGIVATPDDDGCIYVLLPTGTEGGPGGYAVADVSGGLTCGWRDGDCW